MKTRVEISGEVAALLDKLGTAYNIRSTSGRFRGDVQRGLVIEALVTGRITAEPSYDACCVYCLTWQPCRLEETERTSRLVCADRSACNARVVEARG